MTSYVEITLWGGQLPPIKEDVVEAVGTSSFLAHSSMAEGAPALTFFAELSTCRTTTNLYDTIYIHQHRPANTMHPRRYFNPAEYQILEIVVLKRRFFIQHEAFVFRVHHEPPAQHLAEPDFLITIDRSIDSDSRHSFFSSPKLAIGRVDCSLSPAMQQIDGTPGRPVVWRMPAPGHNYLFNLNLSQVGVFLDAFSFSYPQQEYNALYKNCFSHSRILRAVIIRIIQAQQPAGGNNVVAAHEPNGSGVTLGTCFGFHLDRDKGEDEMVFTNYQDLYTQFLS